jgi:preprotein translocase subunit SecG
MEILKNLLWVVQIISAVAIIVLVLLQQGKGADAGATFGSGGSSSLFGASGSANFLSRTTAICALVFFATTLGLVISASQGKVGDLGVMAHVNAPAELKGSASQGVTAQKGAVNPKAQSSAASPRQKGVQIPD